MNINIIDGNHVFLFYDENDEYVWECSKYLAEILFREVTDEFVNSFEEIIEDGESLIEIKINNNAFLKKIRHTFKIETTDLEEGFKELTTRASNLHKKFHDLSYLNWSFNGVIP
tara:strand:- start:208 stop:549 length:342 start_codon:yes stop_codon:yes gene_type:complete